jgi:hypothetical protein
MVERYTPHIHRDGGPCMRKVAHGAWIDYSDHAAAVEQAFRDGVAFATMVNVKDPDLAWEQSRARAALSETGRTR